MDYQTKFILVTVRWRRYGSHISLFALAFHEKSNSDLLKTVCALENFFLAMALHPGAQKRAQAEISAVIGNDRLPEFSDMESLPYVNALVEDVWR